MCFLLPQNSQCIVFAMPPRPLSCPALCLVAFICKVEVLGTMFDSLLYFLPVLYYANSSVVNLHAVVCWSCFFSPLTRADCVFTTAAWNWPWWEYLYYGNEKNAFPHLECQLSNTSKHTTIYMIFLRSHKAAGLHKFVPMWRWPSTQCSAWVPSRVRE